MKLADRIDLFYEREYDVKGIEALNIVDAIDKLDYNFSFNKLRRYFDLYSLMKKDRRLEENLGILFLKWDEFHSDLDLISFVRNNDAPGSAQIFFRYYALKEESVSEEIGAINPDYPKNFLKKALEHKLICENPNLWKNPDDSIQHLRILSRICTKLFYLEENLDEKLKFFNLNYNILLKKGDPRRKEYDKGFRYLRRLFECTSNLAICYFSKGDFDKSKEYINYSLNYLLALKNEKFDIYETKKFPHILIFNIDNLISILINNKEIFPDQNNTNALLKYRSEFLVSKKRNVEKLPAMSLA